MILIKRPDGKIEVDGRVFAVATESPMLRFPGWPVRLVMEQLALHRNYATYGAGKDGDLRPGGWTTLRGIGRIQGFRSQLGVLGAPATLTDRMSVEIYPAQEDDADQREWAHRIRTSWPLNVIWNSDPPLEGPWFDVAIHIPEKVFTETADALADGRLENVALGLRLENVFVVDRERPNGSEDEQAFFPPFEENGRQPGPNLGYVSAFDVRERSLSLRQPDEGAADTSSPPHATVAAVSPAFPSDHGAALRMISGRLGVLLGLVIVLIVVVLVRR